MNRRYLMRRFKNGRDVGSYSTVRFEIKGKTELGEEKIVFETEIHYADIGEGEPVLMVHGIGQSLFTWRNNIESLVKSGFRVIAMDLAGFGYSGCPNIYYTAEEYALVIEAFLDSLNIKHAHIIACSTGCLPAVVFAAEHPRRAGKLVLVSPGAPNVKYPFAMKLLATKVGAALFRMHIRESWVRSVLQKMYFDATHVTKEVVTACFEPLKNREVRHTLTMCMANMDDDYVRSRIKDIACETLVFSGTEDTLHGEEEARFYASIQGAKHIKLRNCAHLPHEEKPMKFNEQLAAFLKTAEDESSLIYERRYVR